MYECIKKNNQFLYISKKMIFISFSDIFTITLITTGMNNKEFNNPIFKKNVIDIGKKMIVKSIYLKKKTKMNREMQTLVWQYYRHRGCLNVNDVIKKYGRDSLIINYSITPVNNDKEMCVDINSNININSNVDINSNVNINSKVDINSKVEINSNVDINSEEYMNNLQKEIDTVIDYDFDPYTLSFYD